MADKKAAAPAADTTQRVATGFWSFFDEIKDDLLGLVRKVLPYGFGALFILPLIFTKEGREVIDEGAQYLKLKYGDQFVAKGHDWAVRAYNLARSSFLGMFAVVMGLGLMALLHMTTFTQVADRLQFMFWDVLVLAVLLMLGFGRVFPLLGALGAAAGVIGSIDKIDKRLLTSFPQFLASGGKTGIAWIDTIWRIVCKTVMYYGVGAVWLALLPVHNDPAMKYLAGLLIPVIIFTHLAYKPGERGPFWWWVNWAIAFAVADITIWCMLPIFKLVFNLGITPAYLAMVAKDHQQIMAMYVWLGTNDWFRIAATIVSILALGAQVSWTIFLARSAGKSKKAEDSTPAFVSSGGVIVPYAPAPKPQRGVAGPIIFAGFLLAILYIMANNWRY